MKQKYIIITLASIETLTLFPILFWGIYSILNATNISQIGMASMLPAIAVAITYASAVLYGSYKSVQNIHRPKMAYAHLILPFLIALVTLSFYSGLNIR